MCVCVFLYEVFLCERLLSKQTIPKICWTIWIIIRFLIGLKHVESTNPSNHYHMPRLYMFCLL